MQTFDPKKGRRKAWKQVGVSTGGVVVFALATWASSPEAATLLAAALPAKWILLLPAIQGLGTYYLDRRKRRA